MEEDAGSREQSEQTVTLRATVTITMLAFVLLAAATTIVSSPHTPTSAKMNWGADKIHPSKAMERISHLAPAVITNRDEAQTPLPAKCIPELRTVKLRKSEDLSLQYIPSCTRIERCGGCCLPEDYQACQPTEIEYLKFKVTVSKHIGGNEYVSHKDIVRVERHLKCKCDCILKETDCNALQEYRKHECKCVCTNHDERKKCLEDNKFKSWDPADCTCQCRNVKECSTGYVYNKHTCSCEPEQRHRINGGYLSDSRGGYRGRQSN